MQWCYGHGGMATAVMMPSAGCSWLVQLAGAMGLHGMLSCEFDVMRLMVSTWHGAIIHLPCHVHC
jgi:hypothetical protein